MTEPIHKGKDLPPVWVIHAASGGDSEAMEQVLRYYDDYMSRLCTRTLYDKDGTPHAVSYTHLDVYKRQGQRATIKLHIWELHWPLLYRKKVFHISILLLF